MANKGQFRKGADPRRHTFTREECSRGGSQPTCHRLTTEHRKKGGYATWLRIMAELRLDLNLPLPSEKLQEAARKILDERAGSRKTTAEESEEDTIPF